jgi:hypothetical protein
MSNVKSTAAFYQNQTCFVDLDAGPDIYWPPLLYGLSLTITDSYVESGAPIHWELLEDYGLAPDGTTPKVQIINPTNIHPTILWHTSYVGPRVKLKLIADDCPSQYSELVIDTRSGETIKLAQALQPSYASTYTTEVVPKIAIPPWSPNSYVILNGGQSGTGWVHTATPTKYKIKVDGVVNPLGNWVAINLAQTVGLRIEPYNDSSPLEIESSFSFKPFVWSYNNVYSQTISIPGGDVNNSQFNLHGRFPIIGAETQPPIFYSGLYQYIPTEVVASTHSINNKGSVESTPSSQSIFYMGLYINNYSSYCQNVAHSIIFRSSLYANNTHPGPFYSGAIQT